MTDPFIVSFDARRNRVQFHVLLGMLQQMDHQTSLPFPIAANIPSTIAKVHFGDIHSLTIYKLTEFLPPAAGEPGPPRFAAKFNDKTRSIANFGSSFMPAACVDEA